MLVKLLYSNRKTPDGGRNLKRKVEMIGGEEVVKKFKLDNPSLLEYVESGLDVLCENNTALLPQFPS